MIPSHAHFIWFGSKLPLIYILGVKSAILNGNFSKVTLHHFEPFLNDDEIKEHLVKYKEFDLKLISISYFDALGHSLGNPLKKIYSDLKSVTAKSNILRIVILKLEGGVYLDTDILILKSFDKVIKNTDFFLGEEYITKPYKFIKSSKPINRIKVFFNKLLRSYFSYSRYGWRGFFEYEKKHLYNAVNNALFGSVQNHSFLDMLLEEIIHLKSSEYHKRFRLGVHLFQDMVDKCSTQNIKVYASATFYPLGPVISKHYFKPDSCHYLEEIISQETLCIHWYASNVNQDQISMMTKENLVFPKTSLITILLEKTLKA